MPESPRQLVRDGKIGEARGAFARLRSDLQSDEVRAEFSLMKDQIDYEMTRKIPTFKETFNIYRHRALVCIAVQVLTSVTGVNVIQV